MKTLSLQNGTALVIVAHPDDETIWMGGTILAFQNIIWTVISLSRRNDPDRFRRFKRAIKLYKAEGTPLDLEDEGIMTISQSIPKIKKKLLGVLKTNYFQYIFTHGVNGEYGHARHKGVYRSVRELLQENKLVAKNVFTFSYYLPRKGKFVLPNRTAKFNLKLNPKLFIRKKQMIQNIYGFSNTSFEYRSCHPLETFNHFQYP